MLVFAMLLCGFTACDGNDASDKENSGENEETKKGMEAEDIKATTAGFKVGDIYTFGSYEQDNDSSNGKEAIEWIVLDKTDMSIFVISKYALDCQPYNTKSGALTWEDCSMRAWLNSTFINSAFNVTEQGKIIETTVVAEDNSNKDTDAGNDTVDKVFLLSLSETGKYLSVSACKCKATEYAQAQGVYISKINYYNPNNCWWWLRSPGHSQYAASMVDSNGIIDSHGRGLDTADFGVRPAMWIEIDK